MDVPLELHIERIAAEHALLVPTPNCVRRRQSSQCGEDRGHDTITSRRMKRKGSRCRDFCLRIKLLAEQSMGSVQANFDVVFCKGETRSFRCAQLLYVPQHHDSPIILR